MKSIPSFLKTKANQYHQLGTKKPQILARIRARNSSQNMSYLVHEPSNMTKETLIEEHNLYSFHYCLNYDK